MPTSDIPVWISWLQALAVPVIAAVGVWIALQQMHIARVKLQHDLYDRRFKVYEAAKTLLVVLLENGKLCADDYIAYRRGTADAVFLMDAGTVKYLGELQSQAEQLVRLSKQETKNADELAEIETWLAQQFDVLTSKFMPSMQLGRSSGAWMRSITGLTVSPHFRNDDHA